MAADFELRGVEQAQRRIAETEKAIDPHGGLRTVMQVAAGQLHRYTVGQPRDIMRVDTGRLKNSIFPDVRTVGREVVGVVGTNVEYAPYVEARYGFFRRAVGQQQESINSLFSQHVGSVI